MSKVAIYCDDIGKGYIKRANNTPHETLREAVSKSVRLLWPSSKPKLSREADTGVFWALRHVNLEIEQGEIVGIIGRNGSGKSTLLKILSRITRPTEGRAELHGRVQGLLEVGTGFHPELTGRENVYMNGTILGMRKAEIDANFLKIVEFAELHDFIETPVKYYSTGMQLRLGFSVASHLRADILLIDEVLAVGDAHFQQKCMAKIAELADGGRTVLLVSHNMAAVGTLCSRCILLEDAQVVLDSRDLSGAATAPEGRTVGSVISKYVTGPMASSKKVIDTSNLERGPGQGTKIRIVEVTLPGADEAGRIALGQPLEIQYLLEVREPLDDIMICASVHAPDRTRLAVNCSALREATYHLSPGTYVATVRIDRLSLKPGRYLLGAVVRGGIFAARNDLDSLPYFASFEILDTREWMPAWFVDREGYVAADFQWDLRPAPEYSGSGKTPPHELQETESKALGPLRHTKNV